MRKVIIANTLKLPPDIQALVDKAPKDLIHIEVYASRSNDEYRTHSWYIRGVNRRNVEYYFCTRSISSQVVYGYAELIAKQLGLKVLGENDDNGW